MSNHLGNFNDTWFSCKESLSGINPDWSPSGTSGVLTVINDIKIPVSLNSVVVDGYLATVVSTADYSPFGVQLDGRTVSAESYRYGFGGMEKDDEIKGAGNSYDFGARILDPRLCRWLSRDALEKQKPDFSPYQSFGLNPIIFSDPDGNDEFLAYVITDERTGTKIVLRKNTAISSKIMCDGIKDKKTGLFANYFDFEKQYNITLKKNGQVTTSISYKILYKRGIKDKDLTTESENSLEHRVKDKPTGLLWNSTWEGVGGEQNGGYTLTTSTGGVSQTKQVSKNTPDLINIEALFSILSGIGKSMTPSKINPDEFGKAVQDAVDKITGVSSAVKEAKEELAVDDVNTGSGNQSGGTGKKTIDNWDVISTEKDGTRHHINSETKDTIYTYKNQGTREKPRYSWPSRSPK